MSTSTRTATKTSTLTNVLYVTRKVQADFLAILDTYDYFSEAYGQKVISDVRLLLDEEVIDRVKFIWKELGTNYVLEEMAYEVVAGQIGLADERPGGIRYRSDLKEADFSVRISYTSRWKDMSAEEKARIREHLKLAWSRAGRLDYSGGRWKQDRTYSQDGEYGLRRKRFSRQ